MTKGVIQKSACILLQESSLLRSVGKSTCLEDERKTVKCTVSLESLWHRDADEADENKDLKVFRKN